MSLTHNAPQVAKKLNDIMPYVRAQLAHDLEPLAQRVAAAMKQKAPKWRSTLTNSIRSERAGELVWLVQPHMDYAINVEKGRRPGKGLPRFFDPAAASIVAWLESRLDGARLAANPKWRRPRVGSARRTAAELELRDRYFSLSRHVKLYGIKAAPFVQPTVDEFSQVVPNVLAAAVQRGIRLARFGRGAA